MCHDRVLSNLWFIRFLVHLKKGRMGSWCCWNVLIGLFYISPAGLHIVRFPDPHVFQRKFKTWLASISLDRLLWLLSLFMLSGGNKKKLYLRIFRVSCFIFCLCALLYFTFSISRFCPFHLHLVWRISAAQEIKRSVRKCRNVSLGLFYLMPRSSQGQVN